MRKGVTVLARGGVECERRLVREIGSKPQDVPILAAIGGVIAAVGQVPKKQPRSEGRSGASRTGEGKLGSRWPAYVDLPASYDSRMTN